MNCEYCGREQKIKRGVTCWRCGAPLPAPVVEKSKTVEPFFRGYMGPSIPRALDNDYNAGLDVCSTGQAIDFGVVWTSTGSFTGKDW